MIFKRIERASKHGLALDENHVKQYMSQIADDRRNMYRTLTPCDDTVQSSRAVNRELTILKSKNQSCKYFLGNIIDHVATLVTHLREIESVSPTYSKIQAQYVI